MSVEEILILWITMSTVLGLLLFVEGTKKK